MSSDPLLSQAIGCYEIVDRLGRGGMATVYRARQSNMQRDVAIKVMSAELAEDPQFIARFELEAQVIANLQHPRILPVHDFGHEGELYYLVMRLIEGDTLYQRLLQGPLTLPTIDKFLSQIAEALDYAHNQGVIHRDLKPNNILLDEWDNIYLMDFGLAKMLAATQQLTASGTMLGTPAYMAPEQWRGEPIDARTDVYALGVILYEMVTGRLPFESDTPYSLMYKHLHDAPPSPREWLPHLPGAVEQIVIQALTKSPDERYQTGGDLAEAFHAVLQGGPVTLPARSARILPTTPPTELDKIRAARPLGEYDLPEGQPVDPKPVEVNLQFDIPENLPPAARHIAEWAQKKKDEHLSQHGHLMRTTPPKTPSQSEKEPDKSIDIDLPEDVPAAVRQVIEWASEKMDHVSIPGFFVSASEDLESLPARRTDSGEWQMPLDAPAQTQIATILNPNEVLAGALYLRGTADWRTWRRAFFLGLILSIVGGIFSGLFNLWFFNLLSTLCWVYLLVQGIRTWRGKIGHYYVGFTPQRVLILPLTPDGAPQSADLESAAWEHLRRLRLTNEYFWLESDADSTYVLGWLPTHGIGGLGRQRKWLLHSPVADLVRNKGFYTK